MATRTNLCPNPCDKVAATYWSGGSRVTGQTGFLRTTAHQYTGAANIVGPKGVVKGSTAYIFSAYVKPNYTGTINILINWFNGSTLLSSASNNNVSVTNGAVTRVSCSGTSPSNATAARINITSNDSTLTITAVLYEKGSALLAYFDGDSSGGEWSGFDGLSTSYIDDTKVAYVNGVAPLNLSQGTVVTQKRVTKALSAPLSLSSNTATQKRVTKAVTAPLILGDESFSGVYKHQNVTAPLILDAPTPQGNLYFGVNPTAPLSLNESSHTSKYASSSPTAPLTLGDDADVERIGGDPHPRTIFPRPSIKKPFRVIAQRILTREIVDWDLPVSDDFEFGKTLTGPSLMKGSFKPEIISVQELGLDPYAYFFHVEIDDKIRSTGILLPPEYDDSSLNFECEGFSAAAHYSIYEGKYEGIQVDPLLVVREIWNHVQTRAESQYGIVVSNDTSPVKIGEPEVTTTEVDDSTDPPTETTQTEAAKPYTLYWWDAKNCGDEIDSLAGETPFDYVEQSKWNSTRTDVDLSLDLKYPRAGKGRDDLLFVDGEGENIIGLVPVHEDPERYASAVFVIGSGEGSEAIRGYAGERLANRVRRVFTITDKSILTVARANARAREELLIRKKMAFEIGEITVSAFHQNAPLGSYDVGDDIIVRVYVPWLLNEVSAWYRIMAWSFQPARDIVRLTLARSDTFTYGIPES